MAAAKSVVMAEFATEMPISCFQPWRSHRFFWNGPQKIELVDQFMVVDVVVSLARPINEHVATWLFSSKPRHPG